VTVDPERASDPTILSLCSATATASVAVLHGSEVALCLRAAGDRHQSESLLPLIDQALNESGTGLGELAGIAVSIGPGAFTSLRIGLATAKGLAFGTPLRVAPVSTLQALAIATERATEGAGERPLIAMLDARRDEVYAAAFAGVSGGWAPRADVLPERVYTAEELAGRIPPDAILVGEGVPVVEDDLRAALGPGLEVAGRDEPGAEFVGRLGAAALARGEGVDPGSLAPRYVRRAEAEVTRTSQRFEVS